MDVPKPEEQQQRIIILGIGFAGLKLAQKLAKNKNFQILLIDRNNYHQFQPLLYQVATAGLEPSSISFPLRKNFQNIENVLIRVAEIIGVDTTSKTVHTNVGNFWYDKLIIALGTKSNYFGNKELEDNCIGLKTVSEALYIRNKILKNYENTLTNINAGETETGLNIAIVGGGPTGVEMAGALAEMRNKILPRDYAEIDFSKMNIYLIEAGERLLGSMSGFSSKKAKKYLERLGVKIYLNTRVKSYDGKTVITDKNTFRSYCTVWAAGIHSTQIPGLPEAAIHKGGRIIVNQFNQVNTLKDVYAIGDISVMKTDATINGHPQVAPVAIQQAINLAKNLQNEMVNKTLNPFKYIDKGSMATVGRNLAIVEIGFLKFGGFFAWLTWMFVHLMSILGVKNKLFILINWVSNYFTQNLSLRLILKPSKLENSDPAE
ncbi:NAD(P)/FAD-dependent oxidoreductase [Draconibacterium sp.]|nr:NAD(P)/FAD-dependent oxidoreductase [Draconibacterium sp.]